ncbi:hypothetical protein [Bradyrhizobium sp. CSA112]|uniref:hypothetical protein n=1 Tax=Bradyrhizobium sp. CSA112 TaxID=2699170 RepID=UPI0023AFDE93|nr:hypothetical protein [Bradyrhizobium sp. CSA112]
MTEALDVVDTLIKGEDHLRSLGLEYLPRIGVFVLLCAVAAVTRNLRFHALFVFAAFVYELSFFSRYYGTLN